PAMAKVLERAKAANIPVTTWDSDLLPADKGLRKTYIGTHNYDIGVNLAKIVMNLKPKGGTICIQSGGPAAANHNERMQGIRDTISGKKSKEPPGDRLTNANGWTEVEGCPLYTNDDFPLSVKQMGEILAKYPNLTAFVPTGGFPQFVPNAYKQVVEKNMDRIKSGKTILVVADTLPVQMDLMKAGYSSGQVGQRPFDMGYKSMFILQDIVNGKQVSDPIYTGLDVCTPATAATCIAK
ncbi:MAG TPA: substrate-binding domain-containing protein, partial [Burkholderiales bacterium]|nr:substrate-binding domain-containing protein [Burkholderiales bacterium]